MTKYKVCIFDSSDPHYGPTAQWFSFWAQHPLGAAQQFYAQCDKDLLSEDDLLTVKGPKGVTYTFYPCEVH